MAGNNRHLSIVTLNVNCLNDPMKRYSIANWVKKTRPNHMCLQETHLTGKNKTKQTKKPHTDL
jgi:exonuclease III